MRRIGMDTAKRIALPQPWLGRDLNCDLGEGEPRRRTAELMRLVTSANVACGGHAGDVRSMKVCLELARTYGVRVGAHPGLPGEFGRGTTQLTAHQLELLLLHQVGALCHLLMLMGGRLHHVKLHGSLYHATEQHPELARQYLRTMREAFPGVRIYARAGGRVAALGRSHGVSVWEEVFADRAYRADGTLVSRTEPGAVLHQPKEVSRRLSQLRATGQLPSIDGSAFRVRSDTVCVHSDSPRAVALARAAEEELGLRRVRADGRD